MCRQCIGSVWGGEGAGELFLKHTGVVLCSRNGGCYDGFVNFYEGPKWRNWTELVPQFVFDDTVSYFQLLVPHSGAYHSSVVNQCSGDLIGHGQDYHGKS